MKYTRTSDGTTVEANQYHGPCTIPYQEERPPLPVGFSWCVINKPRTMKEIYQDPRGGKPWQLAPCVINGDEPDGKINFAMSTDWCVIASDGNKTLVHDREFSTAYAPAPVS